MISHLPNHPNKCSNNNALITLSKKLQGDFITEQPKKKKKTLQILKNFLQIFPQSYSNKTMKEKMREKFNIITI